MRLIIKILGKISRWIFILCLPVLLISASIAWGFNSAWIYNFGFHKYDVSQTTGLSPAELDNVARSMIHYFNSRQEYVQITVGDPSNPFNLFTNEEQIHLKDVKQLVWLDYRVLLISLVWFLGYALTSLFWHAGVYRRQLARSVVWGSSITLGLILIMGVAVLIDFDWLWLQFHFLSFANDFWSAPGYMIALFGAFWFDAVLIAISFVLVLALALGGLSLVYLRRRKPLFAD